MHGSGVRYHAEDRLWTDLVRRPKVKDRGTGFRLFSSVSGYRPLLGGQADD